VVVEPVVVPATGLPHQQTVVLEPVALEPLLCDLPVLLGASGEESDDVALAVPSVDRGQGIRKDLGRGHPVGLLVWDVLPYRTVDVD